MTKLRSHMEEFKSFYKKVFIILIGSSILISITTILFPRFILSLFYGGDFVSGSTALQILSFSLIPVFINYLSVYTIITFDAQRKLLWGNTALIVTNIILNLILIRSYGIIGASLATTISLSLVCLYNTYQMKRFIFSYRISEKKT